jgi:hypothetical protein
MKGGRFGEERIMGTCEAEAGHSGKGKACYQVLGEFLFHIFK